MKLRSKANDEADQAFNLEQAAREDALHRAKWLTRMPVKHRCYNCDEPVGGLFCDVHCQADWEKRKLLSARQQPRWDKGTLQLHREGPNA